MNCPRCDATWTMTIYTDPTEGAVVKYKRKCPECECTFSTVEVYAEVYERLEFRSANYQALVSPESRSQAKAAADKVLREHGRQND